MKAGVVPAVVAGMIVIGGCSGSGSGHSHQAAGKSVVPLAMSTPRPGKAGNTCATVSYQIIPAGVEVTARVAAPATIDFEADDADDNAVGDQAAPARKVFPGANTSATILIKGVRTLDHVSAVPLGMSTDDSCWAYGG